MKKIFLILSILFFMSCTNEEPEIQTPQQDCNCDRVVEVNTFNIPGTPENPILSYYSVYITINDCTYVQKRKTHNTYYLNQVPQLNQCR